jgi:hypothetical protein
MSVEGGAAPTLSAPRDDMSQHEGLFARGGYQLLSIISPLALLLLWDVLVRLGVIDARASSRRRARWRRRSGRWRNPASSGATPKRA